MSFEGFGYTGSAPELTEASAKSATRIADVWASCAAIGAVCESSRWLARRMAAAVDGAAVPIVELGAGYGSVTHFLPAATVSVERDPERYRHLSESFPGRTIVNGCAVAFLDGLKHPVAIVSSIPNVNNPAFGAVRAGVARALAGGKVTQLVTYTYFPINPFAGIFPKSERIGCEIANLPPAFLWSYSS